ncbi:hypothetical protein BVX97_01385 [bacterium E08(2017)]|nr:hypothetical protein BVX97_01385 [bacterium E08(2017)]
MSYRLQAGVIMIDVQEKIEKAKQELEHMIDLNPSIMLLADTSGNVMRANRALLQLLGADDFSNILGQPLDSIFNCETNGFFDEIINNRPMAQNMKAAFKIGDERRLLRFTPVGSGRGAGLFALIINDVTDDTEQATKKEKQHKKEAVQALMGALLHNVNQPLTVIMMRAQLLNMALEKGSLDHAALADSLRDIMRLTTDIAGLLRHVEAPADYVTQKYSGNTEILDIKMSSGDPDFDMSNIGISRALVLALDVHEPGALEHANRVSLKAKEIAEKMGFDQGDYEIVQRCAFLHDVGKLGVPSAILRKPGPLDAEELELMRKHPKVGFDLLNNFHFLNDEAEVAYTHAEWFDGSGYPQGLAGDEIPIRARITAVADAYSALIEDRVYRKAVSPDEAVAEIKKRSGSQFDPDVVNCL